MGQALDPGLGEGRLLQVPQRPSRARITRVLAASPVQTD